MQDDKRNVRLNIRLSESMKTRATNLANGIGTPLSTYLAVLIGEAVMIKEKQAQAHSETMTGIIEHAKSLIDSATLDELSPDQLDQLKRINAIIES